MGRPRVFSDNAARQRAYRARRRERRGVLPFEPDLGEQSSEVVVEPAVRAVVGKLAIEAATTITRRGFCVNGHYCGSGLKCRVCGLLGAM